MDNRLSLIQRYFLLAVNERGKIPKRQMERLLCFVAAGLAELYLIGAIEIAEKDLRIRGALPGDRGYLQPIFGVIEGLESTVISKDLKAKDYAFLDEKLTALLEQVGASLEKRGWMQRGKVGFLGGSAGFVPMKSAVSGQMKELLQEMREEEPKAESAALFLLLERGNCLDSHLPRAQQEELSRRVQEISRQESCRFLLDLTGYLDRAMAAIMAMVAAR